MVVARLRWQEALAAAATGPSPSHPQAPPDPCRDSLQICRPEVHAKITICGWSTRQWRSAAPFERGKRIYTRLPLLASFGQELT